ncbi:MAG: fimbrial protein, partial [Eubacteriales bacterium]|nr:fimbrial protein [Eubacteriales bacterium]
MKMKKCFLILLALALALVNLPVFAAGTGTITIENATVGKTYNVYKIFDATYGDGATSYTIDE